MRWVCSGRNGKGADSCPNKKAVDEEELIQVLQEYFFLRKVRTYKNTFLRWVCSGRNGKGADSCPNKKAVDEEELIQVLQEYFNRVLQQKNKVIDYVVQEFQRVYIA